MLSIRLDVRIEKDLDQDSIDALLSKIDNVLYDLYGDSVSLYFVSASDVIEYGEDVADEMRRFINEINEEQGTDLDPDEIINPD